MQAGHRPLALRHPAERLPVPIGLRCWRIIGLPLIEHTFCWLPGQSFPRRRTYNLAVNPSPEGPALRLLTTGWLPRQSFPKKDNLLTLRLILPPLDPLYRY